MPFRVGVRSKNKKKGSCRALHPDPYVICTIGNNHCFYVSSQGRQRDWVRELEAVLGQPAAAQAEEGPDRKSWPRDCVSYCPGGKACGQCVSS